MKKTIISFVLLFLIITLTSCFTEAESLEWKKLPKSVYSLVNPMTPEVEQAFKESIEIKVNTFEGNLSDAMSLFPLDLTYTGFDLSTPGKKILTIRYKTLTINWSYEVISGPIVPSDVVPAYDWYGDGSASTFTLSNINDLYGFANIVNGRDGKNANDFAGKTVKLADDIDLTGKVWTPIGEGPRKIHLKLILLTYRLHLAALEQVIPNLIMNLILHQC